MNTAWKGMALVVGAVGATYGSVPLYRMFCQKTGFGGTVKTENVDYSSRAKPRDNSRQITVLFQAAVAEGMPWKFTPQQSEVKVLPGEAALAFYTAENKSDEAVVGVSTYNVVPDGAANYFNKIQCFCFEEQRLNAREKVDMPVFFFIDPDFLADKNMQSVDTVILSYSFFKASDSGQLTEELAKVQAQAAARHRVPVSHLSHPPPEIKN